MVVTDETITRINELYRKSKNEGLTPEEAMAFAKDHHFRAIVVDHDGRIWDSEIQ